MEVEALPGKNDVREPLKKGGATERRKLEWQWQTRMAGSSEWCSFSVMEVWVASRVIECGIDSGY